MKVWRIVIIKKHSDDYSKETANLWHSVYKFYSKIHILFSTKKGSNRLSVVIILVSI